MSYELTYKSSAERELLALPRNILRRVDRALLKLVETPRPHNSIKLTAIDAYRIRVGDYRIVYTIDDPQQLIIVQAVRHRRDIYRSL